MFSTWRIDKTGGHFPICFPGSSASCCLKVKGQEWGSRDTLLIRVRALGFLQGQDCAQIVIQLGKKNFALSTGASVS